MGTGCQIAGTYRDVGELRAVTITAPNMLLTHLRDLLRKGDTGPFNDRSDPTIHVWLDRASSKMRVDSDSTNEPELLHSKGGVVCESDGALTLQFDSVTATSYRHAEVTVWSATDGSLIVRLDLEFRQKGLPFPSNHEISWAHFKRADQ